MARVTHVKRAQQRYETIPVIDPETNQPKRVPVMKNGVQRTRSAKRGGAPIFMTVTQEDRTKPLPLETCDSCYQPIEVGTPYKWVKPKSGPYGGRKRSRHEACPTWKVWELSNSWSARIAQVTDSIDLSAVDTLESPDDAQSILDEAAEAIRGLAEESAEVASNVEDGFGHETFVSQEATERAEALESWADEIEQTDIPELPEPDETDCETCDGTGEVDDETADVADGEDTPQVECAECDGSGQITNDDPTDEQMDEWRDAVRDAIQEAVDNCPV